MQQIISHQGETLDELCFRFYGRTAQMVEQVLEANQGLADLGVVLPQGTVVNMPAQTSAPERKVVQLWD